MTLVHRRATTPEGRGSLKSVGASALMGFIPREDIGWACSGSVFHLSPFNEATGVLGSEVSFWGTCLKLWHSGFTKEQGNEAELLPPLSSGSVLLPTVPPPPAHSLLWPTCPTWPFLFLPAMILEIFPARTPLPGQMHLPNLCIPILLWGLTGPSENCDPAAPHTQRQPNLPWLLKPDTWYNQAGLYGASPGQTLSPISSAVAPLWSI